MNIQKTLRNIKKQRSLFIYKNRALSGDDFIALVALFQRDLSKAGIEKHDRVIFIGKNEPAWLACYLALATLQANIIPVDVNLSPKEKKDKIAYIDPAFVVSTDVDQDLPPCKFLTSFKGEETCIGCLSDKKDKKTDGFTMVFSSGTGGKEKAIMLSAFTVEKVIEFYSQKLKEEDAKAFLLLLPLTAIYPLVISLAALGQNIQIVIADPLKENLQDVLKNHPVEVIPAVPMVVEKIHKAIFQAVGKKNIFVRALFYTLKTISGAIRRFLGLNLGKMFFAKGHQSLGGSLRAFISGGANLNIHVLKDLYDLGFTIFEGYGLTELGGVATLRENTPSAFGTVGKPVDDVEIQLTASNEVLIRSQRLFNGYFNEPELTEKALRDGWFYTGDLGHLDSNGNLVLKGRAKDVVVLSDERKKNPEEIEALYRSLPGVEDFAIVGLFSHDHSGDIITMLIKKEAAVEENSIVEAIKNRSKQLDKTLSVEKVVFHTEVPRNKLGKVIRVKVLEVCKDNSYAIQ